MLRKAVLGIMLAILLTSMPATLLNIQPVIGEPGSSDVDYMLCDHHGGWWCDAEKTVNDTEDDLMCWALTATNVLEWTGWGLVGGMWNTDEMFEYSQDYWDDHSGSPPPLWQWWFDGTGADHAGGGNFWPAYTWTDYYHPEGTLSQVMTAIDNWLHDGYGIGLFVGDGAHYITCWGFRYDDSYDKTTNPDDYYLGVWVTNSDDDKWWIDPAVDAPNNLMYYPVDWNGTHWNMGDGFGGWYIGYVCAFEPFPDNNRPVANAGGPYTGGEGSAITFDGSGSSDPDGDTLQYRWDFDNDGLWDTAWSSSPYASHTWYDDYTGTVVLQVHDSRSEGALMDGATASVTVNNVAPTVNAGPDQTVDEGDTFSFSGSFMDPGTDDTHTIEWDFGDGSTTSGTLTPTHTYGDNGFYTVTLTVTDDDGGVGADTLTVTVANVPPSIIDLSMASPNPENPEFVLPTVHEPLFTGSATDPGSDDLTFTWNWGDGTSEITTIYYNDGASPDPYPSPDGTYPFSVTEDAGHVYALPGTYTVTLTVTDDDGGVCVATYEITVLSAEEAKEVINDYIQGLADDAFKSNAPQRKNAFSKMFSAIDDMLADEEYWGAATDLLHNIRGKADGTVDGSSNNDWITDATAQEHICWKIDELRAYLQTLIP